MNIPSFIANIAPVVASALGSPLAGVAVAALAKTLGISEDKVADVMQSGKLTSEQLQQLKLAEIELQKQQDELGFKFADIAMKDRDSARNLQIQTKSPLVPALAVIIVTSFIGVTIATLAGFSKIESAMAGTLIGYLSAKAEQVISFYFGSTLGSQKKDQLLYNSSPSNNRG